MKILVLLKYSLDTGEIKVDSATRELRLAGVPEKIGNIDKNVVEAAVNLKEAQPGTVIQALTLGPASAKDGFKDVLAMGVDEVTLVEDPFQGQGEAALVVRLLERAIRKLGPFDLVMCGFASDDGYTWQVGPRLAERLDCALVSYVRHIHLDNGKLRVERDLDDFVETADVPLPAVLTIAEEAFPPRRTTLMDAIKAKNKPIHLWNVGNDLGLDLEELAAGSLVKVIGQEGVLVQRKRQVWKGQAAELADRLIDALLSENILSGGA